MAEQIGTKIITGPTFDEMLHPEKINPDVRAQALRARKEDPLDPINLFNITWKDENNQIRYVVLPKELTGVDANIVALYSTDFPTGSHKVGAAYSVVVEKEPPARWIRRSTLVAFSRQLRHRRRSSAAHGQHCRAAAGYGTSASSTSSGSARA